MITRNEGYRRSAGKEELSLAIFDEWATQYNITNSRIEGYENNRLQGDIMLQNKSTIELKSQNIGAYAQNFIEVGELTTNPLHATGYDKLCLILEPYGVSALSEVKVTNRDKSVTTFGVPRFFNVGFTPVANGANIMYINNDTSLMYFYTAKKFMSLVANAIVNKGFSRGLGMANEDSVSVFIPNSEVAWKKNNGTFAYIGKPEYEAQVLSMLKEN